MRLLCDSPSDLPPEAFFYAELIDAYKYPNLPEFDLIIQPNYFNRLDEQGIYLQPGCSPFFPDPNPNELVWINAKQ